jgi:hypothetical protein
VVYCRGEDINMGKKQVWNDTHIIEAVKRSNTYAGALIAMGKAPGGKGIKRLKDEIKRLKLDTSHFRVSRRGEDFTNQHIWHLTFLKPTKRTRNGMRYWWARCDCGNITEVIPCRAFSGEVKSCGKCDLVYGSEEKGKAIRQYHPSMSSARQVYGTYRDLPFDVFLALSQEPCYYCNLPPRKTFNIANCESRKKKATVFQKDEGAFTYNGLDRIDSDFGHIMGNVVPCCWHCNKMKLNCTIGEFIAQINRVYARFSCTPFQDTCIDEEKFIAEAQAYIRKVLAKQGIVV